MSRAFIVEENSGVEKSITDVDVFLSNNELNLSWVWPEDQGIRLVLVYKYNADDMDIHYLIANNYKPTVIARDLASSFVAEITDKQCKYLLAPAYFDQDRNIIICSHMVATDWLYKKLIISPAVTYAPLHLSGYKKAVLSMAPAADGAENFFEKYQGALTYSIVEDTGAVADMEYPVDGAIMYQGGYIYILKHQFIVFNVAKEYDYLIEINQM